MNVALAANGCRVTKPARYRLDGATQVHFRLDLARKRSNGAQAHGRQHASGPGSEILRRYLRPSDLAQILIDIRRVDRAANPRLIDVLEQMLAGQILDGSYHPGNTAVPHTQPPSFAALALELEAQFRAVDVEVAGT